MDTKIPIWFTTKDWNFLLSDLDDAYKNLEKEFYANAIVEGKELKCWVRGKIFSVTPTYLAGILHINRPMFTNPPIYDDLSSDEDLLRDALGILTNRELNQCFLPISRSKSAYNNHVQQFVSSIQHHT